jgi:hypothetical protein
VVAALAQEPRAPGAQVALEVPALHAPMTSSSGSLSTAVAAVLPEAQLEHAAQGIDHVRPSLLARPALAVRAGHLGDRGDDPAVVALFVDDRHPELLAHA